MHIYDRPVTLLSVLAGISGEGVLQTVLQGEGGGIVELRERGVGDFIFGKLTVIFKIFQNFLVRLIAA